MAEGGPSKKATQDTSSATVTVVEQDEQDAVEDAPTLTLRLRKPRNDKKVKWTNETVDNEHLNKKKSKCCCVYKKPRQFGESSSSSDSSDDECEHCKGHIEKKRHIHSNPGADAPSTDQPPLPSNDPDSSQDN